MAKSFKQTKLYKETHEKLYKESLELSAIEGRRVSISETVNRLTRIPNTKLILKEDALIKRANRVRR